MTAGKQQTFNRSFASDTRRQCAARRADKRTPCGALTARAGNSNVMSHELH
jgi:hypothetical protein